MAAEFRRALATEEQHLANVRSWMAERAQARQVAVVLAYVLTLSRLNLRCSNPARNRSAAISALSSSGPTVGRPSTSETMMLPETMYGRV